MNERTYIKRIASPAGLLTIACTDQAIIGLWFNDARYALRGLPEDAKEQPHPLLDELERWVNAYFSGAVTECALPLVPQGTAFQQAVWSQLQKIPYGTTTNYGVLAKALSAVLGHTVSARAVGGAVGKNPISIVIPCHRVIGADGSLTGFAAGLQKKRFLLELEGSL